MRRDSKISQITVMIGSEAVGFDTAEVMTPITEENRVGITGNGYGGHVTLDVDGIERTWSFGGNTVVLDGNVKHLSLQGDVNAEIYLLVFLQVFEEDPKDTSGVILLKRKFEPGVIDYTMSLTELIKKGRGILR